MQCVVQCMIVHEWNVWTFKFIFHLSLFYFFFIFSRFNRCGMQMSCPWPCRWNTMIGSYQCIVPLHAIDKLWTTDFDVHLLWMQTKHDASLNLFFFPFFLYKDVQYANVMIGLTNAICKHCALTCYWQTLNHWPWCQFSMNAKCDASLDFSFLMEMLLQRCKCRVYSWWCKCLLEKM